MAGGGGTRIAFQGVPGAYSEDAARRYLEREDGRGGEAGTLPRPAFADVFDAVASGRAELGILPVENSRAGSVREVMDLLLDRELPVVGETFLRIRHCLMALPKTELEDVEVVLSHPQALAQCAGTLDEVVPDAERRAAADTAGSARRIRREGLRTAAAVASERAAREHGLRVLRRGIEDAPDNVTRFLLVAREPVDPGPDARTSLVFSGPDEPGFLHRCLGAFARRDIDLTRIESRPLAGARWEYVFYLDFAGRSDDDRVRDALDELGESATLLRVLGSYPRGRS